MEHDPEDRILNTLTQPNKLTCGIAKMILIVMNKLNWSGREIRDETIASFVDICLKLCIECALVNNILIHLKQ